MGSEMCIRDRIWDAKACVRYLRAHAEEYGYDGDRIGVWGTSAGGHLALLLALTQDVPELEDLSMGNAEVSSAVQACVAWYSPVDIGSIEQDYQTVFGEVSAEQRKLLQAYHSYVPTDALMEQANVLNYLSQDVPPIYLLHGTEDWVVPYLQSQRLYDALYPLVGENITLDLRKGGTHDGTDYVGKNNLSALKRVYKFLNGALRN